ncbi:hypothetical protein ACOMHN_024863 [Nucella lapillus]
MELDALETDALLVEFMDPVTASYRTVHLLEDEGVAGGNMLENNGRVEGRQRLRHTISDDDEMLDIAMDGRDAQGITELPDKSHGESGCGGVLGCVGGLLAGDSIKLFGEDCGLVVKKMGSRSGERRSSTGGRVYSYSKVASNDPEEGGTENATSEPSSIVSWVYPATMPHALPATGCCCA